MNKNPVNGMRDILPREMRIRTYVLGLIRDTYRAYGFTEVETPVVESIENLTGKQGGENEKLIFKIMKRGGKFDLSKAATENDLADSGLRYDLTLPLSRYYAAHQAELPKPFKALQIGPVFRAERPQKGRFREFYQCDIDILGDPTNLCETELILATAEAVSKIGFRDFNIRINDRRILKAMARVSGLPEEAYGDVFIALDKLDKIGTEGVTKELVALGMTEEAVASYLGLFDCVSGLSGTDAIAALAERLADALEPGTAENLAEIFDLVSAAKGGSYTLVFDPTLVRGMGYYTGPVFEIQVPEFGSSVGGGGRYDEMVGRFIGQNTPACGFSIGFERIISILAERGFDVPSGGEKTAILLEKKLSPAKKAEALREAAALRASGKTVLLDTMIKNRRFQKEQLQENGYTDIREIYENPLNA
ncbi:MAG: histidine--tRNA ligase [Lachnospiraceae bacterium]|nr:histidine--tRNA ligase [Lachnospiraceae bacterium]